MADQLSKALMMGAAGAQSDKLYVDDVFKTQIYDGSGSSRSIVTGINLSEEGGLVWIKNITHTAQHVIMDTARGAGGKLHFDSTAVEETGRTDLLSAFNNNGFSIGGSDNYSNASSKRYVSYSFRKAEKFFDVVTWTGNDATDRTIAHNLGSVPGCIIVKCRNAVKNWKVYHRKLNNGSSPEDYNLELDNTGQQSGPSAQPWNETAPTSTHFTVNGDASQVNASGNTYVAYVFAHDAGGFGDAGDQSIIKCGTYTGNGGDLALDIGFEPQWVLIKNYDGYSASWQLFDSLRGVGSFDNSDAILLPNSDTAQITSQDRISFTHTGIQTTQNDSDTDANGHKFIYIAIRRPDSSVGKPPEVGTDVFDMDAGDSGSLPNFDCGFAVDMALLKVVDSVDNWELSTRLMGSSPSENATYLKVDSSNQGFSDSSWRFDSNSGFHDATSYGTNYQGWMWKRHKGLDVRLYKGTGTAGQSYTHSLGAVPEMVWIKRMTAGGDWIVGHKGLNDGTNPWEYVLSFQGIGGDVDYPHFYDTAPTSTTVKVGNHGQVNEGSSDNYLMVLFSSVEGISSIGYWTGDGTSNDSKAITTGFSPRFLLIKRTDGNGNWLVIDTKRGAGNYLRLHSNMAQSSGTMVTLTSTGFTFPTDDVDVNGNGNKYVYYAHA